MDNTRQLALALDIPESVWVVGCGGVGYWTAYQLALAGVPELVLFDPDRVSETNFNRIPYYTSELNEYKSTVLRDHIEYVRPSCLVVAQQVLFSPDGVVGVDPPDWLVATTDTWASRQMCYEWCQKNGVKYLEAAAEGEYGTLAMAPADFATPDEDHPGYASVPVWAGPCISAGLMACAHIIHNKQPSVDTSRMGWDGEDFKLFKR